MKTNITLRVDAGLVREAKVLAASRGTSVSRLLADQLEDLVRREREYEVARRRAVDRMDAAKDLGWVRPATRQDLHERN